MTKYAIEKYAKICKNMQTETCKTMPKYAMKNMNQICKYMQNLAAEICKINKYGSMLLYAGHQ